MEELFKSDLASSGTGLDAGGNIGSSSSEPVGGDWTNPQQSGLDGDLQRSQEAVALNELLQEQGLEGGAVDALVQGDSYGDLGGASDDPLISEVAPPPLALSLVVLDQSLQNWRELAVSAPADAELLVLDQASDGVSQISDYLLQQRLDGQGSYSSLAIVSAGADGLLQLGNGTLEAANLSSYGDQLRTWADSLTSDADLLLFGSNVAASAEGVSFVQELASLTGATEQGGNLLLGEQSGSIETSLGWLEQGIDELGMVLDAQALGVELLTHFLVVGEEQLGNGSDVLAAWQQAQAEAGQLLRELPQRQDFAALMQEVFGQAGTDTTLFDQRVAALQSQLAGEGLGLTVELRSNGELNGAAGAYAAVGHTGSERIYLNADWIANGASAFVIGQVLLEETGHAIDQMFNGSVDSEGDEGALFAKRLTGEELTDAERAAISADNDSAVLTINGVQVLVEKASSVGINAVNDAPVANDDTYIALEDAPLLINIDAPVVDQEQITFNTGFPYGGYQTFTAGKSGILTSIDLSQNGGESNSPSQVTLTIYSGNGISGAIIGEVTTPETDTYNWTLSAYVQAYAFSQPIRIVSGGIYTFEVTSASNRGLLGSSNLNAYASGGFSHNQGYTGDLWFRTSVRPDRSILANDSDAEGDNLSAVIVSSPANGSVVLNADGTFIYIPNENFVGTDSFTYKASDGKLDSNTASVTISVNPVNDSPALTTAGVISAVNEDYANSTAVTLWSTVPAYSPGGGSDESSQTLSYTITAVPSFISLFKSNGTTAVTANNTLTAAEFAALKYKTVANANGTANISFDVIDSGSGSAPDVNTLSNQSVSFTVNAVNDAPAGTVTITGTAAEDQTLTASNDLTDADGLGTISYQWSADGTSIEGANSSTFTLTQEQVGKEITVTASYIDGDDNFESVTSDPTEPVGNVNDQPEGDVTISGTADQGETLTASNDLTDADGLGTISYQWSADGTSIEGANSSTFTLTQEQVGKEITVTASYIDGDDNFESVTSDPTEPVGNVNDQPEGDVTISGTADQGETLTASNDLTDADGLGTISYQWSADGTSIEGANSSTFTLTQEQVGKEITVTASYIDGDDNFESVTSDPTEPVGNVNDQPEGDVTISGTADQGETLTASNDLTDADGLGTISYQWSADGTSIEGANSSTFTLTQEQVGKEITVTASYIDGDDNFESVTSDPTEPVGNVNDQPEGDVTISGTADQGETLTASNDLTDADGLGTISYQWSADGTSIEGANSSTFTLTQEQVGKEITVTASYIDGDDNFESVTSDPTEPVGNVNDQPEGDVTISGTADQGETLTASNDLTDADGLGTISYQWSADGTSIEGANSSTFTLTQEQVGKEITVTASYIDGDDNFESVTSDPTEPVGNVNDQPEGDVTISGTADQGETLTASNDLTDADGLGTISYQWSADGTSIEGANSSTFTLTQEQVGKEITVTASYIDGDDNFESVTSDPTEPVGNVNDQPEGDVTISGTADQGETLTASNDLTDADGLGTISYQWSADGTSIEGANSSTFTLTQEQVGKEITVTASYIDGDDNFESVTSDPTEPVGNVNDQPEGDVTISGTADQGETLTASNDLTDADGLGTISYQWSADGTSIEGANSSTFTLTQEQVGKEITVTASYIDGDDNFESVTSDPTEPVGNVNDQPEGDVTISGTADQGETLTASNDLTDADGLGTISYQWSADGTSIEGANSSTFTLTQEQVGKEITVTASYIDGDDNFESVTSDPTEPVGNVNDQPEGDVTISGTADQGETLTASNDLTDADGLGTISYQWSADGTSIEGANSSTFTLTQEQVGKEITVTASYIDGDDNFESVTSDPTEPVGNVNDQPEGDVTISGTADQGETLTASNDLTDADGLGTISYQWSADGTSIEGANSSTFTLTQEQVGKEITVTASYIDGDDNFESVTSDPTEPVGNVNDQPEGDVTISGTADQGETLTASNDLTDADGLGTISYQWSADGTSIEGANSSTFTLTQEQVGKEITVTASYIDGDDNFESVTSDPTEPVGNVNDQPEGDVTISGTADQGETLTASNDLTDADGLGTISYQWSADGTSIEGANSSTFTLTQEQVGKEITVTASYIDGDDNFESVTSDPTEPVGNVNDQPEGDVTISGTADQGETLTASNDLTDADGLGTISYQWSADGTSIEGANSSTFTLTQEQVGKEITVTASYIDGDDNFESVTSDPTEPVGNVNDQPEGDVTISGTADQGETLTASNDLTDADGLGTISYQWSADGTSIEGANSSTFTLTQEQVGKEITVTASYIDGDDNFESVTSDPTEPVGNVNDQPEGDVTISGTADQGETLTASNDLTDADGLGTISYQWSADGTSIEGANSSTFTLTQEQVGKEITVTASYIDGDDNFESVTSDPTEPVGNVNDQPEGDVTISGTADQGETLTASNDLTDADGLGTISYQWSADGTSIEGANSSTFTLTQEQVGKEITVTASYIDGDDNFESVTSDPTEPVGNVNDQPEGDVTISGTADQGETLTASNDLTDADGLLTDADGLGTISYQWSADGTSIEGANSSTFTLTQEQVGKEITVTASYIDGDDNFESVTSDPTEPVGNVNDQPEGDVTISGTADQGETLTASNDLTDADGLGTISYQWSADGTSIEGANSSTFTLTQEQVGKEITVTASYIDGDDNFESVTSDPTEPVGNVNDQPEGDVTISGTADQGETLTASNDLTDADGLGTISYQWSADGTSIEGANSSTFTLTQEQVGKEITVTASYIDGDDNFESVTSDPTEPVGNVNDQPEGDVTISGTADQGETLTASNDLTDADGLGTISYQWSADGTSIEGANSSTFTLTQEQVGKEITVTASYIDGDDNFESVTSDPTEPVGNVNDQPEGDVTISGTADQGETLTASNDLTDADGLGTISYQWSADGTSIEGANSSTFTLTQEQVGKEITVTASYIDGDDNFESVTSDPTEPVGNVNDQPVAVNDTFTVAQDSTTLALNFLPNDTDPDGDTLSIVSIADTRLTGTQQQIAVTNGIVNVSATGEITFTPNSGYTGSVSFDYTASDGQGGSSSATVNGTVTTVAAQPIEVVEVEIGIESFSVSEESTFEIKIVSQAEVVLDASGAPSAFVFESIVDGQLVKVEVPAPTSEELEVAISSDPEDEGEPPKVVLLGNPVAFALDIVKDESGALKDADPDREGTQLVVTIELSGQQGLEGLKALEIFFAKFYSLDAFVAAKEKYGVFDAVTNERQLLGLDGNPIQIKEGAIGAWVPYMRLKDAQGEYTGNGAVVDEDDDGNLFLSLYFTDNQLGDLNLADGEFFDPGIMYSLVAAESPPADGQPGGQPGGQPVTQPVAQPGNQPVTQPGSQPVTQSSSQPVAQSGVFELASVGSTDSTFASVAASGETVTLETTAAEEAAAVKAASGETASGETAASVETSADSGSAIGSDAGSGSTKPDSSLVQAYAERAFDDLMSWAASSGLISLPADGQGASAGTGNGTRSTTTDESRSLAFVSQALGMEPGLASGMLQALALGGASLYAINRFGGGRLSSWVRKLLPAAPQVAAASAERIVVVFKLLSQAGLQCLVAARVDADKLEILAEQALPMSLSAAAAPSQADLEPHLRKLVERVSNQTGTHDLLLYDPHLRQELPIYDSLGRIQSELQPQSLDGILASLGPDQLVELRSWINRPSGTDLRQHPVGNLLERRQRELRQRMDTDKASLISLLELSLALGQRFA